MNDVVSVIVPVYNRAAQLRRAVASAIAQTYRPLEILIVDDGSTDDTPRAIAELEARHAEVRGIRQENGGPGAARETGRRAARGAFVQYLDSDDLMLPPRRWRAPGRRRWMERRPSFRTFCAAAYGKP